MAETTKPYPSPAKLSEQLQNLCWRIAVELRAVYNTAQTKLSQADADKLYLGIKDKAVSATTADSATKATQDASGNVITQTYAKTSALPSVMTGASTSAAGTSGTVPAPAKGATTRFLRSDGTWNIPSQLATTRYLDGVGFNGGADVTHYGTCATAAATAAKVVACTNWALKTGARICVKFTVTNTVTPTATAPITLNVNNTGAKNVMYHGSLVFSAGYLSANRVLEFIYDGTQFAAVGDWDSDTKYSNMTGATATAAGKAGLVPQPSAGANSKFLRGDGTWQTVLTDGTQIETETYSITEEATTAQSYVLGTCAHVLVYVNSVLATDGGTYGIVGGTTLKFNDILPVGTEVVVIKFVTTGVVTPTASYAIDSALSTTSQNAVQNKVITAAIANALKQAKLDAHPVGSYYWSSKSTSPADLFGGTWTQITDRFIYAAGSKSAGATGGEENHTLTAAELAAHGHNIRVWNNAGTQGTALEWSNNGTAKVARTDGGLVVSSSAGSWTTPPIAAQGGAGDPAGTADQSGGGSAHNNMPPYLVAYCWRRTA